MKKYRYLLKGLDCAACAKEIEERLEKEEYLSHVIVNFSTLSLSFETERTDDMLEHIKKIVKEVEPEVEILEKTKSISQNTGKINILFVRLILGIMLTIIGCYINLPFYLNTILILLAYVILLYRTCKNAIQLLWKSHLINENFLITISCIGAYLVGERMEGLMVIILYEIGKLLEEKALNKSRKSIADLMDIKPEVACLEDGRMVDPETVCVGDIILVKAGEKIPLDGVIIDGESHLNTSSLTGESKLLSVQTGDSVLSGSINQEGILKIKVKKDYQNSTVNKILELVENATDRKAKTETFVNTFSKIYTPIVLALALLVAVFLPIITEVDYHVSIYRALCFLVISCPCAIAISVPLSYFSGIGRASKEGILIKGSDYLDSLRNIKTIVFDKTGTLTTGTFGVTKIEVFDSNYTSDDVVRYAALGEKFSNHPLAKSILDYYHNALDTSKVKNYQEIAGKGISYQLNKHLIQIGSQDYVQFSRKVETGTNVFVSIDKKVIGVIILNDLLKEDAKEALNLLQSKGIKTKMFTGDNRSSATLIAKELNIKDVRYEMLPNDKYLEFVKIMDSNHNVGKIAFVGDGINDSPVLAVADIGISMGGIGTSAAIEASDVVIMTDSLLKINQAISISKITNKIIKENLFFSIIVKIIILFFSVFGIGGMWQAIFADVGVTLITIFNSLRILKSKN